MTELQRTSNKLTEILKSIDKCKTITVNAATAIAISYLRDFKEIENRSSLENFKIFEYGTIYDLKVLVDPNMKFYDLRLFLENDEFINLSEQGIVLENLL